MKNKKKSIKRIGALLCAVVVAVSSLGVSGTYYASANINAFSSVLSSYDVPEFTDIREGYEYIFLKSASGDSYIIMGFKDDDSFFTMKRYNGSSGKGIEIGVMYGNNSVDGDIDFVYSYRCCKKTNYEWGDYYEVADCSRYFEPGGGLAVILCNVEAENRVNVALEKIFYCSSLIYSDINDSIYWLYDWVGLPSVIPQIYNKSLGYLKNVSVNHVFEDVPLGENVGEKYASRWYYDELSTTGIDLTNGDYMINYYQERWIVTGYGEDDVVKKSDRYLLGTYIVQNGYIETYSEDVESTLAGQGYEEPSVFDLLWNKFITTHYYFQIVNARTNEVGGLLHIYLTDDNGKFGVEHIGETLDNEGNFDEGGYKDFIDEDKITTDDVESGFDELEQDNKQTLEEWLEDLKGFESDGLDDMDGAENLGNNLQAYASQIANVTKGVGALFGALPDWILGLLGVSFACLFFLIVIKVARG